MVLCHSSPKKLIQCPSFLNPRVPGGTRECEVIQQLIKGGCPLPPIWAQGAMSSQDRGLIQVSMMKGPQIGTTQALTPSPLHSSWEFSSYIFKILILVLFSGRLAGVWLAISQSPLHSSQLLPVLKWSLRNSASYSR